MPFLLPNQQCQSIEGKFTVNNNSTDWSAYDHRMTSCKINGLCPHSIPLISPIFTPFPWIFPHPTLSPAKTNFPPHRRSPRYHHTVLVKYRVGSLPTVRSPESNTVIPPHPTVPVVFPVSAVHFSMEVIIH